MRGRVVGDRLVVRRSGTSSSRPDDGLTLVEVVVSIVLLMIVLAPTAYFVISAQSVSNEAHLRAEADHLATQQLETAQANADAGLLPTGRTSQQVDVQEFSTRQTSFTVETSYTTVTQGTSETVCQSSAAVPSQIWQITVKVTWRAMHGAPPVVQTTEIAPGAEGASQQFDGELAVSLTTDGTVSDPYTGTPTVALTGSWQGLGSAPPVPSGEATSRTLQSSGDGCVVFQNMDADTGWVYTLSFAGNPAMVSDQEYSDANPNGALTVGGIVLQPGVLLNQVVIVDNGTSFAIEDTGPSGACGNGPALGGPPATPSEIPISVENSFLTYPNSTWIAYSSGGSGISSLSLFPWSGDTYLWAGDQPYADPSSYNPAGTTCTVDDAPQPATPTPTAGLTGSPSPLYLPLYPLYLAVSGSGTGLAAEEVAGGLYSYTLNLAGNASATSLPLGEYRLTDSGGGVSMSGGSYVWVEPSGDCVAATISAPPTGCSGGSGSPIAVTAS